MSEFKDLSGAGLDARLVAVNVGNTRTRFGLFDAGRLERSQACVNTDLEAVVAGILSLSGSGGPSATGIPVVVATVNAPVADRLVGALADSIPRDRIFRLGSDLAILMPMALDDDSTVGQDRLLAAMGAYSRAGQACVVIDAGTAVTVDFVDGEGTFQGGAIAPGLTMMLDSLHRGTAALPKMEFLVPDPARGVIGKDTRHAMTIGVRAAVTGMARVLIDSYAEVFGAYPQVVATGGDAAIFENDPLVEHIVPDLVLLGIAEACRRTLMDDPQDQVDRERSARAARGGGFESRLGRHEGTSGSEGGSHDDPNPRE
ncbi:MAG: type III pantothenate kinase [Phycisphaeraceae bacterium]|nr:type III pantothenate kinase [Phycisphaerae bacterium]MBX3391935.1 type III pantothenate kinase [Phycisphaeraceae bacterium]